ncbi:hypothetical protein Tco_0707506 [Tanacetum coccineum]|uniref:Meiosis-specific nuclear structural protein 1 n=1 Tax=Tanacetum coccineum TaxID=301880 RepID=A0ABQ4YCJ3_9ASTR
MKEKLLKAEKRLLVDKILGHGRGEKSGSTADQVSTARPEVSTARPETIVKMRSEKARKQLAKRLHEEELAELDRAQKERQKQEEATSATLAEEFDEIQAKIDANHELAVRLIHKEQEKYTIEERARLLAEFFKGRKKQLAAERVEAIRNNHLQETQTLKKFQKLSERDKEEMD